MVVEVNVVPVMGHLVAAEVLAVDAAKVAEVEEVAVAGEAAVEAVLEVVACPGARAYGWRVICHREDKL